MRTIPQRVLRNSISQVLREVEAGERLRITVDGRPVAELVPVAGARRTFVPREDVARVLAQAPLDVSFDADLASLVGATIDEI